MQEYSDKVEDGLLAPGFKPSYSLLFGSSHFYMVFKMIATIYERLLKAKQLIKEKVEEDLEKQDMAKEVIGENGRTLKDLDPDSLATFKQEVSRERF